MDHQKVFSTHIFVKDNYLAPQRLPAMREEIDNIWKQKTGYNELRKRLNNWQTEYNLHKTEPFKWFANDIGKTVFDIIDELNYDVEQIEITGMWGNILKPGETHSPHTHSNNFLSGVFYLESDAETGIIFSDPRPAADVLVPRKKTKTNENSNLLSYISKQNRLIIFPSWLVHWVPINKSKRDRISISFNIQIKGQVGEHHEFQSAKY